MTDFTYTDEQWSGIKDVVLDGLDRDDADQIELTRTVGGELARLVGGSNLTATTSLRSCIEKTASLHIADSAVHGQTPGYKASIKKLEAMRARTNALHSDLMDAIRPTFTVGGDDVVRRVIFGGDVNADPFDETGRAFATLLNVIDASIAACRPQETANTSKADRDRFWNEMLAIWISIGGAETGTAAAKFIAATSQPVFDRVRAIGGSKTAVSTTEVATVIEWLRVRKAQQAATS